MSGYTKYSAKERKAWGKKMAAAKAAKAAQSKRKPRRNMRGRGDYYEDGMNVIQGARDYVKTPKEERGVGETIGRNVGGFVGRGIQQLVKNITGFGDYEVSNNSLMSGGLSPPQIINSSNTGGFIVRHREYLGDISATTAFNLAAYPLNPGLSQSFPWLSTVASCFEQYKWRGVVFEVKSLSSDAVLSSATSSALGSVIMATEYNSLNDNFANKNEMENHMFANSRKPSEDFMHPIECKSSLTTVDLLYVRSGIIPANADLRLYDLGRTQIATVGMQAASGVCSELWVTYEVELYKPTLASGAIDDLDAKTDHFKMIDGTVSGAAPFGTTPVAAAPGSNIGCVMTYAAGQSKITFPNSAVGEKYFIYYQMKGDSVTGVTPPGYSLTGGVVPFLFMNNNPSFQNFSSPNNGVATSRWNFIMPVNVTTNGCAFTFTTGGTLPNTNTIADLFIIRFAQTLGGIDEPLLLTNDDASIEDEDEIPDAIKRFLNKKGIKL